jgi:hypothetical protein
VARGKALAGFSGFGFEPKLNEHPRRDKSRQCREIDVHSVSAHGENPLLKQFAAFTPKWPRVNEAAMDGA